MLPKHRTPTHPGEILKEDFLNPLSITPAALALRLGPPWNEAQLQALVRGEHGVTPELADLLAQVLSAPPQLWTKLQELHHQWIAIHHRNEKGSPKPWSKAV